MTQRSFSVSFLYFFSLYFTFSSSFAVKNDINVITGINAVLNALLLSSLFFFFRSAEHNLLEPVSAREECGSLA